MRATQNLGSKTEGFLCQEGDGPWMASSTLRDKMDGKHCDTLMGEITSMRADSTIADIATLLDAGLRVEGVAGDIEGPSADLELKLQSPNARNGYRRRT